MIFLASTINDDTVLNIISKLLQSETLADIECAYELLNLIPLQDQRWTEQIFSLSIKLLENGKRCQAKEIARRINYLEFIQNTQSQTSVKKIFNFLPYIQDSVITMELLDYVESNNCLDQDSLIELKLQTVRILIMIGERGSAKKIIQSISVDTIIHYNYAALSGLYYIYLSMFEEARYLLKIAGKMDKKHAHLSIYTAINYFCQGDIKKAIEAIEQNLTNGQLTPFHIFYKSKFLNCNGLHEQAYNLVKEALDLSLTIVPEHRCIYLVEIGNTLRLQGKDKISIQFYKEATELKFTAVFWLWIAYFEYAMTLISLGKTEDALRIVSNGSILKSQNYNTCFNPCKILRELLLGQSGKKTRKALRQLQEGALLWPFPHLPYKFWMLVHIGIVFEKNGLWEDATHVYYDIIKESTQENRIHKKFLQLAKDQTIKFHNQRVLLNLKRMFWPNDPNWKTILIYIGKKSNFGRQFENQKGIWNAES